MFLTYSSLTFPYKKKIVLKFYMSNHILLRFSLVKSPRGKFYLYTIMENISESLSLMDLENKFNYTYLLICSLSHELLTPINNMKNSIEVMKQHLGANRYCVKECNEECEVMDSLTDGLNHFVLNILNYARYLNKNLQIRCKDVDAFNILTEVTKLFKLKTKRKKVRIEVDCPHIFMKTDPEKLAGLLYIFLDNSVKYTHQGSIKVVVREMRKTGNVRFEIIDTGIGIEEGDLRILTQIMENPFTDLKTTSSAGVGIGFRVAQALIMHLSAGDVNLDVVSKKGNGTTLMFEIHRECRSEEIHKVRYSLKKKMDNDLEEQEKNKRAFEVDRMLFKVARYLSMIYNKNINVSRMELDQRTPFSIEVSNYNRSELNTPMNKDMKRKTLSTSIHFKSIVQRRALMNNLIESKEYSRNMSINNNIYSSDAKAREEDQVNSSFQFISKKIAVVVDDEILNAEYLKDFLETYDMKVYTAYDGGNAVELCMRFLTYNKKIDIIFMDYSMPSMNGDVCAAQLRSEKFSSILQYTPIVGLTAHNDDDIARRCLDAGMTMVEFKPISIMKIKGILEKYNIMCPPVSDQYINTPRHSNGEQGNAFESYLKKVSLDLR